MFTATAGITGGDAEDIISSSGDISRYDVKKAIGSGEFCDVFKATDRATGRCVALKRLKIRQMLDGRTRFDCLREIRLLSKLDHGNIIRLNESFFANNELYIVLEYADAGDLAKMLDYFRKRSFGGVAERNVWNFFAQICTGLSYMHSKRVMHRDLKPANVLLNRDGTVKLGDLGLSAILSATTDHARSLVGTPYYMAPERLSEREYGFAADIWSLGCLLYELVTLFPPFYAPNQNIHELIDKIRRLAYVPIGGETRYSAEVGMIVAACLVLEPANRIELAEIYSIAKRMNERFARSTTTATAAPVMTSSSLSSTHNIINNNNNNSSQSIPSDLNIDSDEHRASASPSSSHLYQRKEQYYQHDNNNYNHHHHQHHHQHHPHHHHHHQSPKKPRAKSIVVENGCFDDDDRGESYRGTRAQSCSSTNSEPYDTHAHAHHHQQHIASSSQQMFKQFYRNLKNIF